MHFFLRKHLLVFVLLYTVFLSKAQKHEFGLSVGGVNNTGDVNFRFSFKNYRPAAQFIYRYNISKSLCARISTLFGQTHGSEQKSKYIVPSIRQASFSGTITETAFMLEYNFINYRDKKTLYKYSPYFCTGFAIYTSTPKVTTTSLPENSNNDFLQSAWPIGVGIKHAPDKHLNLHIEFVARKCFSDYLDGISNGMIGKQTTGNPLDTDWYFYTGAGISYTFYKLKCPQPQEF